MKHIINGLLTMLALGALSLLCFAGGWLMNKLRVSERVQSIIVWTVIGAGMLAFVVLGGGSFEPFSEDRYRRP